MTKLLLNKTAVVTGGSNGYGFGIAKKLKEAGANVWITGRSIEKLKLVASELKINYIKADVTNPGDWDDLVKTILNEHGQLDILINNAGGGIAIADITDQSDLDIKSSIDLNLLGAIYGSKRAAEIMVKQKSGTIVNISSICSTQAWPGFSIYAAAKAGLEQFSRSLYVDLRPHNVRAMCITPSWGNTSFNEATGLQGLDEEVAKKAIQPEDMGKVVVDACSLPEHLIIPELTIIPMVQEIIPF
ncbi:MULTISPECIES: SDR family oxidoreductase [unclassified Arenibacter]|uniref:SDR family oxidoreductase n=1 Tax=unclassified Arenibacter TaxID=2615047 RepID=UPI000E34B849|nr:MULTISPECIES: SDR family oxidoreductase [unclassified Arenibacter]MCM4164618.1 hypothetical protein [Arenibacter sp. A80]RFT55699.1 SDR family oxidoreductase [Arenibacter sp. P308M17]